MKINGKLYVTFEEMSEAFGLTDVKVQLVTVEPADLARGMVTIWFNVPNVPRPGEGCEVPVFSELMMRKEETRKARRKAVGAIVGLWRQLKGVQ